MVAAGALSTRSWRTELAGSSRSAPSAADGFLALLEVAVQNQPTIVLSSIQAESTEVVLCTDATPSRLGYGGVLLRHGAEPLPFGARFDTPPHSIGQAEAAVVFRHAFAPLLTDKSVRILVDNTSAQFDLVRSLRGRSSRNLSMSFFSWAALGLLRRIRARVRVDRIASDRNPADAPSRATAFGSSARPGGSPRLFAHVRGGYTTGERADGAARPQR
jgi:hypothetical protein